jgi:hypothetical protein
MKMVGQMVSNTQANLLQPQQTNFQYTSAASSLGKGERADPLKQMPYWTPGPDSYNIAKDGN